MHIDLSYMDRAILLAINHWRTPFLDMVMPWFSDPDTLLFVLAPILAWRLVAGDNRERCFWIGAVAAVLLSDMICARILKPLVGRPRPFTRIDGLYVLKNGWILTTPELRANWHASLSWPSCHAANMWTATGFALRVYRPLGWALGVIAALVCYSRVYLGVHYPADVAGGALLGLAFGWACARIAEKAMKALAPGWFTAEE